MMVIGVELHPYLRMKLVSLGTIRFVARKVVFKRVTLWALTMTATSYLESPI